MKKLLLLGSIVTLASCQQSTGELVGVHPRAEWFDIDPFGMLYLPMGSYNMGPSDEDTPYSHTTKSKTVSVQAFYIDQTEISNNEYRQFVYYVKDSLAHRHLIDDGIGEHGIAVDDYGQDIDPPLLNWDEEIDWEDQGTREALEFMYLPPEERFYKRRQLDTRKLNFEYYWINFRMAAQKSNRFKHKTLQS